MARSIKLLFVLGLAVVCQAQVRVPGPAPVQPPTLSYGPSGDIPAVTIERPKMTPDLTLQAYEQRSRAQMNDLAGYSAVMVISASLPDSKQTGEYEVTRSYEAPATLKFKGVKFTGDNFVKTNVITRLLQSEVDHMAPEKLAQSALNSENYKFAYRGTGQADDGRTVHIYLVKPRHKVPGLFKGYVYLDATTGSLVHAEGEVAKSPSVFVKKIQFKEDFVDIGNFTFPVRMHSTAKARIIGQTVVDIVTTNYTPTPTPATATATATVTPVPLPSSN